MITASVIGKLKDVEAARGRTGGLINDEDQNEGNFEPKDNQIFSDYFVCGTHGEQKQLHGLLCN